MAKKTNIETEEKKTEKVQQEVNTKRLYRVVEGALIEGHATYYVGSTLELTEERASQIGNQVELIK